MTTITVNIVSYVYVGVWACGRVPAAGLPVAVLGVHIGVTIRAVPTLPALTVMHIISVT